MEELTAGIGSRVQHARFGPGVIIGVKYAQYVVTFINAGRNTKTNPFPSPLTEYTRIILPTDAAVHTFAPQFF